MVYRKADHFRGRENFGDVFIGSKTLRIQEFTIAERKYNHSKLPQHPKVINLRTISIEKGANICLSPSVQGGSVCMVLCITAPNPENKNISIIYLDLLSLTRLCRLLGSFCFLPNLPFLKKWVYPPDNHIISLQIRTTGKSTIQVISPLSWIFHLWIL